MEKQIHRCPICHNERMEVGVCYRKYDVFAYNIYCPKCNFTGRSYRMRYKAIEKWNALCKQFESAAV